MSSPHSWKFHRIGGLDQVALESGADLLNLEHLDPKLWVALSCPVKGLELDEKTLALMDLDGDGRIRIPEILAAIKWAALRVKDVGEFLRPSGGIPLAELNDATPEGQLALASAKQILANLGKPDATHITVADTSDTKAIFAHTKLNGDGIIPADAASSPELQQIINEIIAAYGPETDRSGKPGITQAKLEQFYADLPAFIAWTADGAKPDVLVAADKTAAALAAVTAVKSKVDDFFGRCRLAAYDGRATAALNRQETEYLNVAAKDLNITADEIKSFPLAKISADAPLPLTSGINPAWAAAVAALYQNSVTPIFGAAKTSLTSADWETLQAKLAPFAAWSSAKAGAGVHALGLARAQSLVVGNHKAALTKLIADDAALAPQAQAIADVDRLARFDRDLGTLLRNFVNFNEFYSPASPAIFQTGTLYLDSRSCDLCIRVDDPGAHSALASLSKCYVAYCDLKRPGGAAMKIAAIFSQGDSDYLMVGRNGLFFDRAGRDWDATITKIIDNPISIRQAFWAPYKKFVRMIDEQIAKRAAAADAEADAKLAATASTTANVDKAPKPAPAKIDVGIVAALGVAMGALTTAFAYVLGFFKGMPAWQIPLVFLCVMFAISLPSMIIAALKLRQRTLGPILDANGWAINGRVKINIPFGTSLTGRAILPPGSTRSLTDPYEDKEAAARAFKIKVVLFLLLATWLGWNLWAADHFNKKQILWPDAFKSHPEAPAAPTPETAPAK